MSQLEHSKRQGTHGTLVDLVQSLLDTTSQLVDLVQSLLDATSHDR